MTYAGAASGGSPALVWVRKAVAGGEAGEDIYDARMVRAIEAQGVQVRTADVPRVSRLRELANLAAGVPYYRAKYLSPGNLERVRGAAASADPLICSWEPLDILAFEAGGAAIPILHNLTSTALPSMYPGSRLAAMLARRAAQWERRAYGSGRFPRIGVLSRHDERGVNALAGPGAALYLPPGVPPLASLADDAVLAREVVLLGTFDWRPKRRDLLQACGEIAGLGEGWTIHADSLPAAAAAVLRPLPAAQMEPREKLRFGLVTDRFEAGHKLKVGSYIAANAIVVSYADVMPDYAAIEDSALFIRRIERLADLPRIAAEFQAIEPAALRQRWRQFQQRCAEAFSWDRSARALLAAVAEISQSAGSLAEAAP